MTWRGPVQAAVQAALRSASGRLAVNRIPGSGQPDRHPLAPAAIRVERTRSRRSGANAEQTAVTMWFGSGPALPGPATSSPAVRTAVRLGAGMIGAAALAAATAVASRRTEQRLSSGEPPAPRRLGGAAATRGDPELREGASLRPGSST